MDALGLARFERLQRLDPQAQGEDPEQLREAAEAFEAVFVNQLLKSMRATIQKSALTDGGYGEEIFTDMLDQEYAGIIAQRGLGLSDLLVDELGGGAAATSGPPQPPRPLQTPKGLEPLQTPKEPEPPQTQTQGLSPSQGARRRGLRGYRHAAAPVQTPTRGRVTQLFDLSRRGRPHEGLDIAAPKGQPIHAAQAGVVRFAGARGPQGQVVILEHGDGLTTRYAHASTLLVEPGQPVTMGQAIARVGSTGESIGPHLHFEVRRDGRPLDPARFLGAPDLKRGEIIKHTGAVSAPLDKRGQRW